MHKNKSMLGKGNRPRRPIVPLPIPASVIKHRLGSGLSFREKLKQHIAKQKERPIIFTPVSNSTPEDKSQIRELRNAVNSNAEVKHSLFPRSKENSGPTYHSGSVQGITASSKPISSRKTPVSYNAKIADPPQLLKSGSSKMPKTFIDKESGYSSGALFCSSKEAQTRNKSYSYTDYPLQENSFASKTCPENLQISCRNISKSKATQTSPFRVSTEDKSILEMGAASSAIATNNNDSVYVKKELLKLKKKSFEMNSQIDGILSRIIVGATELQSSDFSNEKNESSAKCTRTRRSQRIAARMSNSLAFVSPGTLSIDECNAKSFSSNSELNKSLPMYKELKRDFTFLRTPNASNKKRQMKSPGTLLSDKFQDQLKLLFD